MNRLIQPMLRPTAESANESARFSETLKIQYLDLGSIPAISTNWNACGILYLWSWTHTASGSEKSYGYVYMDVAIVLFWL